MVRSPALQKARDESSNLKAKPTNEELLDLYGLGKIADGEDIATAEKPGMFDLTGKAKRAHWNKLLGEGIGKGDAEKRYIDLVEGLKAKYGLK